MSLFGPTHFFNFEEILQPTCLFHPKLLFILILFATPLPEREVINTVANSVSKKDYALKCNTPLCDKDKCKFKSELDISPPPAHKINISPFRKSSRTPRL